MRYSRTFIPTTKETPADAEVVSHRLMLRAGMIRKLTSGIYTYLPAGLRAVRKVERIVREEMDRSGAVELLMPGVQPAELWQESGRWEVYGRELLRLKDRHGRDACLAPTHEEVITDLVRREIHSYRQMPVNFYQIQTKFRDEIRPRFGIMRGREFIMKDAYSFDGDEEGAARSYEIMHETYDRIFRRCGLTFRAVEADTGSIGGSFSHEYMVLAESGEDQIVSCLSCDYAANLEKAEVRVETVEWDESPAPLEEVDTPGTRTIEAVTSFLSVPAERLIKTLIFRAGEEVVVALVRGDHELNEVKLKALLEADQVELADPALVERVTGAPMGFAGPVGIDLRIVADHAVAGMRNAVTGGNRADLHLRNVDPDRDFTVDRFGDLRVVTPEDPCPRCGARLRFGRGIEVGHIFKLGTKYSRAMGATYLDENGREIPIVMGCYGIGVGRTVAAAIEQNHDKDGIVFPIPIAPYEAVVLPLQMNEPAVVEAAEALYLGLRDLGVDTLLDDRDLRAGAKFKDADLLGTPVRVTIGSRSLGKGEVEIKLRSEAEGGTLPVDEAARRIQERVRALYG
jgi:prolyl-tRNA synthetase